MIGFIILYILGSITAFTIVFAFVCLGGGLRKKEFFWSVFVVLFWPIYITYWSFRMLYLIIFMPEDKDV